MTAPENLKISIVTVVFNDVDKLEKTILSVVDQDYKNIEYIVIDGGSTDGTVDLIKKYQDRISYWISEPDRGIYDAMNKGINVATGEWICFMNSGDFFYNKEVLSDIFNREISADIIYGDTVMIIPGLKVLSKALPLSSMLDNKPFCHQSSFIKTSVQKLYKYNTDYCISADYDFFFKVYNKGLDFEYHPAPIAVFDCIGSFSANDTGLCVKEDLKIKGITSKFQIIKNLVNQKIRMSFAKINDFISLRNNFYLNMRKKNIEKRKYTGWVEFNKKTE